MTKHETISGTSTALALPEPTDLAALFKSENGLNGLLDKLESTVKAEAEKLDASTRKGRDGLTSLAYKVSQSKAEMDRQGLALTEKARAEIAAVNAGRKAAKERLDALRDETKKPVTEWEAKEAARVDAHKTALKTFDLDRATAQDAPSAIIDVIASIEALTLLGPSWEEFEEFAAAKSEAALAKYRADLAAAEKRVADEQELAKLRAEAAERARRDAEDAERKAEADRQAERERLAADAAERAEQERAAAVEREAQRQAQAERDREEAARIAAEAAKAEAERAAKEAEERHARELAEAKAREERAAQAERDRIAAEQRAKDEARAKREADHAHRERIRGDIIKALESMRGAATPGDIADALMGGKIPHVEVTI